MSWNETLTYDLLACLRERVSVWTRWSESEEMTRKHLEITMTHYDAIWNIIEYYRLFG